MEHSMTLCGDMTDKRERTAMDIAVLSDIHGNHVALEHCMAEALSRGITTFFFLGDYLGELAYPQRTMQLLYEYANRYNCYFVKGNREDYWLDYRAGGEQGWRDGDSTTGSLWYTYHHLTEKELAFFTEMKIAEKIALPDMPEITICHGSPYSVNEKMLPDHERTREIMEESDTELILCGHTHVQNKIEHAGKRVLNPGAVGVPLGSGGLTQFLILHGEGGVWSEEFISQSYDIDRVVAELHEERMEEHAPSWCRVSEHLLYVGEPSHGTVLNRAMELCKKTEGSCEWPNVPEKYWQQAVSELL